MQITKNKSLVDNIINVLKTIYDPEIPVNIYELGLIYDIKISSNSKIIDIIMTLTSPNCPVAEILPEEVKEKVKNIEGIDNVNLHLTFEPQWTSEMISEEARLELGML